MEHCETQWKIVFQQNRFLKEIDSVETLKYSVEIFAQWNTEIMTGMNEIDEISHHQRISDHPPKSTNLSYDKQLFFISF